MKLINIFLIDFKSNKLKKITEVTKILWYAAISSHELTPPDVIQCFSFS